MKNDLKITLIITVKNEQNTIATLLESITHQSLMPNEIIITDAGSVDNTKKIIISFKKKLPQINVLDVSHSNRGYGRNVAIKHAKNDVIAVTDAGCTLKSDWLQMITNPIKRKEGDSVAGFYLTSQESPFQSASAPFVAVMPDQLNPDTYLPSSRSVAFTKKAWEAAGKYPENVNYCEDLIFAKNLKEKTNLVVQPTALVYWDHFKSLGTFFRQIKNYASGDVEARYWPHIWKIISVYLRYAVFAGFPPLFFAYLYWPIAKHYKYVKHPAGIISLPLMQLTTDMGIAFGSLKALL